MEALAAALNATKGCPHERRYLRRYPYGKARDYWVIWCQCCGAKINPNTTSRLPDSGRLEWHQMLPTAVACDIPEGRPAKNDRPSDGTQLGLEDAL